MKPNVKIKHLDMAANAGWYWFEVLPNPEYNGPFASRVEAMLDMLKVIGGTK